MRSRPVRALNIELVSDAVARCVDDPELVRPRAVSGSS